MREIRCKSGTVTTTVRRTTGYDHWDAGAAAVWEGPLEDDAESGYSQDPMPFISGLGE